ncbi:hypothetical protein JHK86_044495 [Glycine max]|nr:hypothetical protein JHK86_044495 [Glycine max]
MATLLNFLQLYCACVALMVVGVLFVSAESTLLVYFKRVPPPRCRSSNAVFQYLVERLDGSNAYTIPPTAAITSEQTHTNGQRIAIDVTFSEPCTGIGGFHCLNSSNCDIMVAGPAQVDASSLQITRPGAKYSLGVIISSEVTYGRVVITMVENTCTDQAGNKFRRTNDSTLIIHFDRRPVMVDFWTSVPSYELKINGIPRTVVSTSKPEDLIIFLDFSIPTRNSTEQVLNALHVNSGILTPLHGRSNGTRGFSFKLKNISRTEIITIELQATSILGRTGTPVSPVAPITFLYDPMKPNVVLRTSSLTETRDFNINIIAEFTKPVFGFVTSIVDVSGGRLIRQVVKELSRAFYLLTVKAVTKEVSVTIPAGKVTDISGNENLASNQLAIKHYSTPAISIALHSFISAGTIATSLVAAMVSLSSANLEALSILALEGASSPASNPSINLHDMEMNLFWLGVGGSCLLLLHVFAIFFLRHRIGRPPQGSLSVPRFELFLLILMLPCLSQSSTFIIKGGTTGGIITGVLLLAIPVAFILSSLLFLVIAIYTGSFAQYKEFNKITNEEKWYTKLWFFFIGRPMNGKWFNKEGLPSSFLSRFGILFDNWKGPPVLILGDQNEQNNTITKWSESDKSGIRRTKTASSEDSNEETKISTFKRVFGCIRASYIILDLLRRVGLGIISAAYPSENSNKSLFALIITLMQFIFLFTTKPYISRGVHVVESVSLLCEAGAFVILILHNGSHSVESKTWELVMLFLLMFTFIAQITNQWYAMVNSLLNLSQSQNKSLRDGLKLAAKGLILPFLPSKHWSSVISTFSQTETDILSLNPICSGTEFERRNRNGYMDPISAMTATVVPVQSPSTPSHNVIERRDPRTWGAGASSHIEVEGKWLKGHNKAGLKKELKMLRELAKASFSGDTRVDEASTSYTLGEQQHSSGEIYLGNPKRRYY